METVPLRGRPGTKAIPDARDAAAPRQRAGCEQLNSCREHGAAALVAAAVLAAGGAARTWFRRPRSRQSAR